MKVPLLVGRRESADRVADPRGGGERREDMVVIGPDDDTDDPALLFVGEDGRELYPYVEVP